MHLRDRPYCSLSYAHQFRVIGRFRIRVSPRDEPHLRVRVQRQINPWTILFYSIRPRSNVNSNRYTWYPSYWPRCNRPSPWFPARRRLVDRRKFRGRGPDLPHPPSPRPNGIQNSCSGRRPRTYPITTSRNGSTIEGSCNRCTYAKRKNIYYRSCHFLKKKIGRRGSSYRLSSWFSSWLLLVFLHNLSLVWLYSYPSGFATGKIIQSEFSSNLA